MFLFVARFVELRGWSRASRLYATVRALILEPMKNARSDFIALGHTRWRNRRLEFSEQRSRNGRTHSRATSVSTRVFIQTF